MDVDARSTSSSKKSSRHRFAMCSCEENAAKLQVYSALYIIYQRDRREEEFEFD